MKFETHSKPTLVFSSNTLANKVIIGLIYLLSYRLVANLTLLALGINTGGTTNADLFFPATGLTIAFILYFGLWIIPLIPINIIYQSMVNGRPLWNVILFPVIIMLGYGVACIIIRKILKFDPSFKKLKDGLSFLVIFTIAPLFVGFTFGFIRLYFAPHAKLGFIPFSIDFFIGDVVGIYSFTPLLLVIIFPFFKHLLENKFTIKNLEEALKQIIPITFVIALFTLFIFNKTIFISPVVMIFFAIPLTFFALQFGLRGSIITNNIIILSVLITLKFAQNNILFNFQVVIFSLSGIAIIIGVVLNERDDFLKQLLNQKKDIEKIVEKRTEELEITNNELKFFTYSVSHDLRAPLTNIETSVAVINEFHSEILDSDVKDLISRIDTNSSKMKELIDALLKFFTFNQLPLTKENIDMAKLLSKSIEMFKDQLLDNGCELNINFEYNDCFGDPSLISTVWNNLLSNALKFSSKNKQALIDIGNSRREDGAVVFFIRDNGVGFDMEEVPKLFQAFQRLHHNNEFTGTGIGLALVKRIIERHGGKIWVESKIQEGSTFYFTLE